MRWFFRRGFVWLAAILAVVLSIPAQAVPAGAVTTATVAGTGCVGSNDTVSWVPVAGALGYRVVAHNVVYPQNPSLTYDLPADQTSLQFPVQFGILNLAVYSLTQSGFTQLASVNAPGSQKPQPMQWDSYSDGQNKVGDGSVTVAFFYIAESIYFDSGNAAVMVTVTANPGGASITSQATLSPARDQLGVSDTFTGLTPGVHYTFVSVASNECGSSDPSNPSDILTPTGDPGPAALTCQVTGTAVPPAVAQAQQYVQVRAADGLNAISNIHVVNGVVNVATYTPGTTAPVVVTATKTVAGRPTIWSFDMTDITGQAQHCT